MSEMTNPFAKCIKDPECLIRDAKGIRDRIEQIYQTIKQPLIYLAEGSLDPYKEPSIVYSFVDKLQKHPYSKDDVTFAAAPAGTRLISKLFKTEPERKKFWKKLMVRMKKKGHELFGYQEFIKELKGCGIIYETNKPPYVIGLTPEAVEAKRILDMIRGPSIFMFPIQNLNGQPPKEAKSSSFFEQYKNLWLDLLWQAINEEYIIPPRKKS